MLTGRIVALVVPPAAQQLLPATAQPAPRRVVVPPPTPAATAPARPAPAGLFPAAHAPPSLTLLLWAPLGLVVAPARACLWALLYALDAPWLTDADGPLRAIFSLLGVSVEWRGAELPAGACAWSPQWNTKTKSLLPRDSALSSSHPHPTHTQMQTRSPGFHVAVSNHSSVGDFLVLYAQPRRFTHLVHPALPVTPRSGQRVRMERATAAALRRLRRRGGGGHDDLPVHLFPEGGLTGGTAGLMRFSRAFASLHAPVAPLAIVSDHALGIKTHTLRSSFGANLFWLCFAPTTRFTATVLPAMAQRAGEGEGAFAERVRAALGDALGQPLLDYGLADKVALRDSPSS